LVRGESPYVWGVISPPGIMADALGGPAPLKESGGAQVGGFESPLLHRFPPICGVGKGRIPLRLGGHQSARHYGGRLRGACPPEGERSDGLEGSSPPCSIGFPRSAGLVRGGSPYVWGVIRSLSAIDREVLPTRHRSAVIMDLTSSTARESSRLTTA